MNEAFRARRAARRPNGCGGSQMEDTRAVSQLRQPSMQLVMGLGLGAVVLFLGAILGAIAVSDEKADSADTNLATGGVDSESTDTTVEDVVTTETTVAATDGTAPGATGPAGTTGPSGTTVASPPIPTLKQAQAHPCAVPRDATGVTASEIKWALHAPKTFDGQPLNLAEDPLE